MDAQHAPSRAPLPHVAAPCVRIGASTMSFEAWFVDLDGGADALPRLRRWLSADELARAERFRSDRHRSRYIVGRATLRHLLARRLGCAAAAVRLSYGDFGKPLLEGGAGSVAFSVAHSEGDAVIALSDDAVVGVDIERLRPIADFDAIARVVFSDAERRELDRAPDPLSAFLNGWTRKEAYLKALGLGFMARVTDITVSLCDPAALLATGRNDQSASAWRLFSVPHPRAVVAVALGPRLNCPETM